MDKTIDKLMKIRLLSFILRKIAVKVHGQRVITPTLSLLFTLYFIAPVFAQTEQAKKDAIWQLRMDYFRSLMLKDFEKVAVEYKEKAQKSKDEAFVAQIELSQKEHEINKLNTVKERIKAFENLDHWVNKKNDPQVQAAYGCLLGSLYLRDNQYAAGFAKMLEGIKAFEKIGFEKIPEVGYYLNQLGNFYYHFEDYDKAQYYLEKSAKLEQIIPRFLMDNLNTQSLIWFRLKNYPLALEKIRSCIAVSEAGKDSVWIGIANGNLGNIELRMGDIDAAIKHLQIDYLINRAYEPDNTANTCLHLAEAFMKKQNYNQALFFCLEASRLRTPAAKQDTNGNYKFLEHYYRIMGNMYKSTGNAVLANEYLDSCIAVKDSLDVHFNANIITSAEQRIAAREQISKLEILKKDKLNTELKRNLLLAITAGIVCILLLFLRLQFKNVQKNKMLFAQKEAFMLAEKNTTEANLRKAEAALVEYVKNIASKNEQMDNLKHELQLANEIKNETNRYEKINELLRFSLLTDDDWNRFKTLFDAQFPGFYVKLKEKLPWLTPAETRLLLLLKLNLTHKEIAAMLGIAQSSVSKLKFRFRKKLEENNQVYELEDLVVLN